MPFYFFKRDDHPALRELRFWQLFFHVVGASLALAIAIFVVVMRDFPPQWFHVYVVPVVVLLCVVASIRLSQFRCPSCGERFIGTWFGPKYHAGDCVHCGFPRANRMPKVVSDLELTGFCIAHAIQFISEGRTFAPVLVTLTDDGQRVMESLSPDAFGDAVEVGRHRLDSRLAQVREAVLLYDGKIEIDGRPHDAIIAEVRGYGMADSRAVVSVPYTWNTAIGFRVHRPKMAALPDCELFDESFLQATFFRGVELHEKGSKIWSKSLDESK